MTKNPPHNKQAEHAISFLNALTLSGEYEGQPVKLRKWQENIVRQIFGSVDKHGKRTIKKVFILLPRGSGKTQLIALLVIYFLLGLKAKGQQIVSAAMSRDQASRVYDAAQVAIDNDPFLKSIAEVIPSQKRIVVADKHSFYLSLSSEGDVNLGLNPAVVIFDELEVWKNDKAQKLYHNLTTSLGKRTETLVIMLATGIPERNPLVLEQLDYAKKVEAGIIKDPSFLPILFYAKDDEDWTDEKVWKRVHPAAGDFFSMDFLRRECAEAKQIPSKQAVFRAFYLNQFTENQKCWIPDTTWMKNAEPPAKDPSTIYYGGLDLASVKDSNCFILYGQRPDGRFDVIPFYWTAGDQIYQRTSAEFNYRLWHEQGYIRSSPGAAANQSLICRDIVQLCQQYHIKKIGADPHLASWLTPELEQHGIVLDFIPQTTKYLSEPLKRLETQALNSELCHGGNPVLRWHLSNAWCVPDPNGNYFINQQKSSGQTDGCSALATAIASHLYDNLTDSNAIETESLFVSPY